MTTSNLGGNYYVNNRRAQRPEKQQRKQSYLLHQWRYWSVEILVSGVKHNVSNLVFSLCMLENLD